MIFALDMRWAQRAAIGAAFGLVAGLTGSAWAQFGEAAGIAEAMQSDFFKRDVTILAQDLKLDSTQRVIVDALFEDYQAAIDQGIEGMKQKIENMRDELRADDVKRVLAQIFQPFKEWLPEKTKIGEQFLENVKVVLTDEQTELWPEVERRLYREHKLHKGRLSGESLDLFAVIRELHVDEATAAMIQPTMSAYSIALDEALRKREDGGGVKPDMLDAMAAQDAGNGMEVLQRHIALQRGVRDVNEQYMELIAEALPEELRAQFRSSALERAYPQVYRETPVQRLFKKARELDGVDPKVLQAVVETETAYLNDLVAMNQRLRDTIREQDPSEASSRAEDFNRRMSGGQVKAKPNPSRAMFTERDDLSRRYAKQLQSLLTAEQFVQLPGGMRWVEAPEPAPSKPLDMKPDQHKPKARGPKGGSRSSAELDLLEVLDSC